MGFAESPVEPISNQGAPPPIQAAAQAAEKTKDLWHRPAHFGKRSLMSRRIGG